MRAENVAIFAVTLLGMLPVAHSMSSIYTSLNGAGCTNLHGFDNCISGLHKDYEICMSGPGDLAQKAGCQSTLTCSYHNCWTSNCRNELNGCAYQYYAFQAADQCGVKNIEGFPAPAGAPGRCSCPIGQVLEAQNYYFGKMDDCYNLADKQAKINCLCCAYSGSVSAYYGLCPGYDAGDADLIDVTSAIVFNLDINFQGWQCPDDYHRCQTVYGMINPPAGKYLNINSHLPSGTLSPTIVPTATKAKSTTKHTTSKSTKPTSTHKTVKSTKATSTHHSAKTTKAGTTHSTAETKKITTTHHSAKTTKAATTHSTAETKKITTTHHSAKTTKAATTHSIAKTMKTTTTHHSAKPTNV
ncbi:hypothetical protein V1508DRAFT_68511 [Lipomyces doorenjongii]|uniref:uncharacterized protein n=1 Tax=Lipomyces doorenjongii TaxID=383834 RepID=UPI0034CF82AB